MLRIEFQSNTQYAGRGFDALYTVETTEKPGTRNKLRFAGFSFRLHGDQSLLISQRENLNKMCFFTRERDLMGFDAGLLIEPRKLPRTDSLPDKVSVSFF